MSRHVDEVKNKLAHLRANTNVLDLLMEFERTLDNSNLYAYRNWINGEIIEGPTLERYWVTVKLMYPYKMMPDPMGGLRLQKYGCKVSFEKDTFKAPVKILSRDSFSDFAKKKAKIKVHKVWVVTIVMPKRFLDERLLDTITAYGDENSLVVDTNDISQAYDNSIESTTDADMTGEES
jgi:hypothetical protein